MASITLKELADKLGAELIKSDGRQQIEGVATLLAAGNYEVSFLTNDKYAPNVSRTKAAAIITGSKLDEDIPQLISDDAYFAFARAMEILHGHRQHPRTGISPQAAVSKNAKIAEGCNIHSFAVISDDVKIGKNCNIYPGVFIGPGTQIKDNCSIYANAVIYEKCLLGERVIVNANATIGVDGFGYAQNQGRHHRIPQIGRVILENDVEIGAGCSIQRGTLDDTVIGEGSKIGDLSEIAHGVRFGKHCLVVGQAAIAGSSTIGDYCVLGGQVGIVGHIKIGNFVRIGAQAGVINDVADNTEIIGAPAIEAQVARRAYSLIEHLPTIRRSIKQIKKQLKDLTGSKSQNEDG